MDRKQINEKWDGMTPRERDTWVASRNYRSRPCDFDSLLYNSL